MLNNHFKKICIYNSRNFRVFHGTVENPSRKNVLRLFLESYIIWFVNEIFVLVLYCFRAYFEGLLNSLLLDWGIFSFREISGYDLFRSELRQFLWENKNVYGNFDTKRFFRGKIYLSSFETVKFKRNFNGIIFHQFFFKLRNLI